MLRTVQFALALLGGVAAIVTAALVPVHLRAVDPRVLAAAGRSGKSVLDMVNETIPRSEAVAKLLLYAAEDLHLPNTDQPLAALRDRAENKLPGASLLRQFEDSAPRRVEIQETPVLVALAPRENRERLAQSLKSTEASRLLQTRTLTNFSLFAPVGSAAGFPLDAAILASAFLMDEHAYASKSATEGPFRAEIMRLAADEMFSTNRARTSDLEEFYIDIFALAKRFSSEQLIDLVSSVQDFASLDRIVRRFQEHPREMPILYAAVVLSRDGRAVANYLARFPETGFDDISLALSDGVRALNEVLQSDSPIYRSAFHNELLSDPHLRFLTAPMLRPASDAPALAFILKFALLFAGGLLLIWSISLTKNPPAQEEPWLPRFSLAQRAIFAGVFVTAAVLLGEPYLVSEVQGEAEEPPTQLNFTLLANVLPPNTQPSGPMINASTLVAMGVFFVLQGSIYLFCLTKLAEIRRQQLSSVMKLKLMENEENLFDAGLYCGLFGTAASLILLTIGAIKPSLISAYSSTLFGILFVALIKIFHVRPYKRRLILESATVENEAA
ncbi:MAG TPA: hypothetical protein VGR78_07640 [Verrucomicrobiae bacterium]|nr:hypothetical protein [Verrucomicrobiae bacterium]